MNLIVRLFFLSLLVIGHHAEALRGTGDPPDQTHDAHTGAVQGTAVRSASSGDDNGAVNPVDPVTAQTQVEEYQQTLDSLLGNLGEEAAQQDPVSSEGGLNPQYAEACRQEITDLREVLLGYAVIFDPFSQPTQAFNVVDGFEAEAQTREINASQIHQQDVILVSAIDSCVEACQSIDTYLVETRSPRSDQQELPSAFCERQGQEVLAHTEISQQQLLAAAVRARSVALRLSNNGLDGSQGPFGGRPPFLDDSPSAARAAGPVEGDTVPSGRDALAFVAPAPVGTGGGGNDQQTLAPRARSARTVVAGDSEIAGGDETLPVGGDTRGVTVGGFADALTQTPAGFFVGAGTEDPHRCDTGDPNSPTEECVDMAQSVLVGVDSPGTNPDTSEGAG